MNLHKYLAEFLGAAALVYVILATGNAFAIGATLTIVILAIGSISGGHINPAVSFAMVSAGQLDITQLIPYIVSQILGGLVALEIYRRYKFKM
jgi:glycerol uptake facilitator-like aquaporin